MCFSHGVFYLILQDTLVRYLLDNELKKNKQHHQQSPRTLLFVNASSPNCQQSHLVGAATTSHAREISFMTSHARTCQRVLLGVTVLWVIIISCAAVGKFEQCIGCMEVQRMQTSMSVCISQPHAWKTLCIPSHTGVLVADISNHPAVLGGSAAHHLHMRLWRMRRTNEEATRAEDFAIHRFATLNTQATRRLLKENAAVGGEAVAARAHDARFGASIVDNKAVIMNSSRQLSS